MNHVSVYGHRLSYQITMFYRHSSTRGQMDVQLLWRQDLRYRRTENLEQFAARLQTIRDVIRTVHTVSVKTFLFGQLGTYGAVRTF